MKNDKPAEATIEGSQWAIGVNHKMSKRARAYAAFMSAEYEHNMQALAKVNEPDEGNAGANLDRWAIGLIHTF